MGYVGGSLSGISEIVSSYLLKRREESRQRELYNRDMMRSLEDHYMSEDHDYSSSMSSHQSSSSSQSTSEEEVIARVESNALGTPYFASLEKRMKEKGLKEEEFFKKEEFDI
jgi:hypothetical protein